MKIASKNYDPGLVNYAILCNDNSPADARLLIFYSGFRAGIFLVAVPSAAAISITEIARTIFRRAGNIDGDGASHEILAI